MSAVAGNPIDFLMEAIFISIGTALFTLFVAVPYLHYYKLKARRDFEQGFRFFKLRQIYRFYPEVLHIDWRDLEEMYDIEASYQQIGTRGRSRQQ